MTNLTRTTKRTYDVSMNAEFVEESVHCNYCGETCEDRNGYDLGGSTLAYEGKETERTKRWTEHRFDISVKADYVTELMYCNCGMIHELRNGYDFGDGVLAYAS